jgi:hypothetical protein
MPNVPGKALVPGSATDTEFAEAKLLTSVRSKDTSCFHRYSGLSQDVFLTA